MEDLYEILEFKSELETLEVAISLASKEHPFFKAHFKDNEILAGFLQIDILLDILKQKAKKIKRAKFLEPIYPNNSIKYFVEQKNSSTFRVVIKNKKEKKVSEFSYEV